MENFSLNFIHFLFIKNIHLATLPSCINSYICDQSLLTNLSILNLSSKRKRMDDDSIPRVKEEKKCSCTILWDCGSPLYDSFEVVSIHYMIDKHLMKLPYDLQYHVTPSSSSSSISSSSSSLTASLSHSNKRDKFGKVRKLFSSMASSISLLVGKRVKGDEKEYMNSRRVKM